MLDNDQIFSKIAEALLIDYSSVYYVNAVTNEYQWYSIDPEYNSLQIEQGGDDFFKNLVRDAEQVVYEEDKHIFIEDIQKEKLLQKMKSGTMQSVVYRLMIDGRPVYHTLRLIREVSEEDDYFIFGVLNIDKEIRMKEEAAKLERERELFNQIAASLAEYYEQLYYVNAETGHYYVFSKADTDEWLQEPLLGEDFFEKCQQRIQDYVYMEDQDKVMEFYQRETFLNNLKDQDIFSMTYRRTNGRGVDYFRCTEMWASDRKHIIVSIENINAEVIAERVSTENQKNSITYSQIAESLASRYDVIYYVKLETKEYKEFTSNNIYGNLEIQEEGHDFFQDVQRNARMLVHPEDVEKVLSVLNEEYLLFVLSDRKKYITEYRLMVDGKPQNTRLSVTWSSDRSHFVIGVENITDEVRREEKRKMALQSANEKARRDDLTGVKNKNAYQELEQTVQDNLEAGIDYSPFALVVCDLNNLKQINDTKGHKEGDRYICEGCKIICDVFSHSPVFRIGGDEFVAFLTESDYSNREELFENLRQRVLDNQKQGEGPVIATGMAAYDYLKDTGMSDVFQRADGMMYKNKKALKGELI